nr:MAG TPA: hypothetical protein [Bacteriophage sp.]
MAELNLEEMKGGHDSGRTESRRHEMEYEE